MSSLEKIGGKNKIFDAECVCQTYSGLYLDILNPKPEDILLTDIAHHLSLLCRFNGACSQFYSVAEHCLLASQYCDFIVPPLLRNRELRAAALLHDAAEAYLGDLISPLKKVLPQFKVIEDRLQNVIYERFNICLSNKDRIELKKIDLTMLSIERRDLMPQDGSQWESLEGIPHISQTILKLDSFSAKLSFLSQAHFCGLD